MHLSDAALQVELSRWACRCSSGGGRSSQRDLGAGDVRTMFSRCKNGGNVAFQPSGETVARAKLFPRNADATAAVTTRRRWRHAAGRICCNIGAMRFREIARQTDGQTCGLTGLGRYVPVRLRVLRTTRGVITK